MNHGQHRRGAQPAAIDRPVADPDPAVTKAVDDLVGAAGKRYEIKRTKNRQVVYVLPSGSAPGYLGVPIYLGHDGTRYQWCWTTGAVIAPADRPMDVMVQVAGLIYRTQDAS